MDSPKTSKDVLKNTNLQIYANIKPIRLPLILTQIVITLGTIGYMVIDDFKLIDAIYQTGITFTTVGFGEIAPISKMGRLFTITLVISGFALFSIALATISSFVNSGVLVKLLKERRMLKNIIRLHNHYVVYYYNEYTQQVIEELRKNHTPFVVVDPSKDLEQVFEEKRYPHYIIAEPHTQITHLKANLSSARGAIVLSKNTSDNIAQIVSVRLYQDELGRSPYHITSYSGNKDDMDKLLKLGADEVLSPTNLLARKIANTVLDPQKAKVMSFFENMLYGKNSPLKIEEFQVSKTSWIALKKLKHSFVRDMTQVSIIGITDHQGKFVPMPHKETIIGINSILLLLGSTKHLERVKKILLSSQTPDYVIEKERQQIS